MLESSRTDLNLFSLSFPANSATEHHRLAPPDLGQDQKRIEPRYQHLNYQNYSSILDNYRCHHSYIEERLHIQSLKGCWTACGFDLRIALHLRLRIRGRNHLPEVAEVAVRRQRSLKMVVGPTQEGPCSDARWYLLDSQDSPHVLLAALVSPPIDVQSPASLDTQIIIDPGIHE